MGGNLQRGMCHISATQRYRSTAASGTKQRMHILRALLYVSLVAAPGCSSLPAREDRTSIHRIINIAQITLVHIRKLKTKLPVGPQIETSAPSIEGLTGISRDLGLLDNELRSPFTELLSQIQADVSSLEGRVRSLARTLDCPVPARPGGGTGGHAFPDSHFHLTLTRVQRYLETFLLHKDKLRSC